MANTTFLAGGRRRRLKRRKHGGNFYINFEYKGKQYRHSLGTTLENVAIFKAKKKIEDVINGDWIALEQSKQRTSWCTVAQILDRYDPSPDDVRPESARNNKSQLRLLVREGAGLDPDHATAAVFATDAIVKNYHAKRLGAVRHADRVTRRRAAASINSTVRQAKSVLSRKHMELYRGLNLPDLAAFRAATPLPVRMDYSFVPFPAGVVDRIDAELPLQARNIQIAGLLIRYAGLRNKEVQFAKWEWFRRYQDGTATLSIELQPYFEVKNNSVRTLHLDRELVARLEPFWGADYDWVMDAEHETGRYLATHTELNAWLRQIIPQRPKCAYELRKYAGSVILTRPEREGGGLAAAARFLGDTIQTTEKHYARFLKPVHVARQDEDFALPLKLQVVA